MFVATCKFLCYFYFWLFLFCSPSEMASKKHVFTQIEKKVFMDILKSHARIIENKNTDGSTLREKNVAWDNITREYNASPHVTAEVSNKQLRRLWINLKQRQRESITKERQHRMATGGGPSTSSAEIDPDVAEIAPALIVEIPGAVDSDTVFLASSASMDIDFNQPDLTLDSTQNQEPPTSTTETPQQPHLSPVPSPTTTTLPPAPLSVTLLSPCTIMTPPPPRSTITHLPPRSATTPPLRSATTPPPPRSSTTPPSRSATTPSPPSTVSTPQPPPSTVFTSATSVQRWKQNIVEKEYRDRVNRAGEIHALEKELLMYKIREAKAKAELAELTLQRERSQEGTE